MNRPSDLVLDGCAAVVVGAVLSAGAYLAADRSDVAVLGLLGAAVLLGMYAWTRRIRR